MWLAQAGIDVSPRRHSLIRSSGHWHTRRGPRQTPPKPRWHGNTHFRGTGNPSHAGMCKKTRVMFAAVHSLLLNVSQQWRRSSHRARRKGRGVQEPHPPYRLLRRHRHWCHRSGIGNTGARTVLGPGNLRLVANSATQAVRSCGCATNQRSTRRRVGCVASARVGVHQFHGECGGVGEGGGPGRRGTGSAEGCGWEAGNQRRGWDSNPRDPQGPTGFRDRLLQPLGHLSQPCIIDGYCLTFHP